MLPLCDTRMITYATLIAYALQQPLHRLSYECRIGGFLLFSQTFPIPLSKPSRFLWDCLREDSTHILTSSVLSVSPAVRFSYLFMLQINNACMEYGHKRLFWAFYGCKMGLVALPGTKMGQIFGGVHLT